VRIIGQKASPIGIASDLLHCRRLFQIGLLC
jgi:hypothetical protein